MPLDAATRDGLIREALETRLRDVTQRLDAGAAPRPEPRDSPDEEEALRIVMVRLWPAFQADPTSERAFAALAETVMELGERARSADWRFLDAWNNVYET